MQLAEIKNITVIGLGTMGPGIAQSFAMAGYQVTGYDPKPGSADLCLKVMAANLKTFVEAGTISEDEAKAALSNMSLADSLQAAVENAHLVIESVTENREIKKSVFQEIDQYGPSGYLLWSNTSTLNIYELLPPNRQEFSIIAHWFAPPHIIPLVEVVKGPKVTPETVELTLDLLKILDKTPVLIEKFVPGFIINRIQRILGREVFFLLENGYISPEDLDLAVKASLAPRMMILGLVQRYDFTGLDLSARNLLDEEFFDPPIDNRPASLQHKIDQGHLGVKTGQGFFDYRDRELTEVLQERDRLLLKVVKDLKFCWQKKRLV